MQRMPLAPLIMTVKNKMKLLLTLILSFCLLASCTTIFVSGYDNDCPAVYYERGHGFRPNSNVIMFSDSTISINFTSMEHDTGIYESLRLNLINYTQDKTASDLCECAAINIGNEYILFSKTNVELEQVVNMTRYYQAYKRLVMQHYSIYSTGPHRGRPLIVLKNGLCDQTPNRRK